LHDDIATIQKIREQAEASKTQGNLDFGQAKFESAVEHYNKAIGTSQ
jgi:hypothetical protein